MNKKIFLLIFLFINFNWNLFAQDKTKKVLISTCKCASGITYTFDPKLFECFEKHISRNLSEIQKELKIEPDGFQSLKLQITKELISLLPAECPEYKKMLEEYERTIEENYNKKATSVPKKEIKIKKDTLKLDSSVCSNYRKGKHRIVKNYVLDAEFPLLDSTNYIEIKDNYAIEYSFNKKYKTTWKVDWINKCDYDLTLINTNYPDLKESMKNNNVLNYKVIGSTVDNKLYQSFKILGIKTIVLVEKL